MPDKQSPSADPAGGEVSDEPASIRAAVALVFVWIILGAYSVDIVQAIHDFSGSRVPFYPGGIWAIGRLAASVVLVVVSWPLKRSIERADGHSRRNARWWWLGAVIVVVVHLVLTLVETTRGGIESVWAGLLAALVYSIGMVLLLVSALNADPTTLFSQKKRVQFQRDWVRIHSVLPAAAGTMVLYFAKVLWFPDDVGIGVVKDDFFIAALQFIPLVLITLGLEFNFARRGPGDPRESDKTALPDPVCRAAPIVTVILMCVAMFLAFSTLMNDKNGDLAAAWHEYIAFGVSVQATTIGLATVVWLLLADVPY